MGPLQGIRIIDMTSVLMGPFATQQLGDMGADVIKVEAPQGDVVRQIGPARHADMGPIFLNTNRNKRALTVDLKKPEGVQVLHRLVKDADALVYNVRPQAMARLGLGYDALAEINPRLVYAGVFGFGQDGPYAARPAYDDLIQGAATLSYLIARAGDGTPRYVPTAMADRIVGTTAVGAILAALLARERTGRGQRVDVPMFETMVGFVLGDHLGGLTFDPPLDAGGYPRQLSPYRRPYRTRDGYICALVYNDKQWESFLRAIELTSLLQDERFATFAQRSRNIDFVYERLVRIFEERTTAEWMRVLEEADIPMMPMHDFDTVLSDPHLSATGFFGLTEHPTEGTIRTMRAPASFHGTPPGEMRHAPNVGEHTREILREAGYAASDVDSLIASGAVQAAASAHEDRTP